MKKELFKKKGQMNVVGTIIALVLGVGIAVLIMIFIAALSGQTYELVEADIDSITNTTVKTSVKNSIISSFEALEQVGDYLPLIVLAVVIGVVLTIVLGFTAFGGAATRGGSVL